MKEFCKIYGIPSKTIQYLIINYSDLVSFSFPEELESSDILLCQSLEHYRKYSFKILRKELKYKAILILDYEEILKGIEKIEILSDLTYGKIQEIIQLQSLPIYVRSNKDSFVYNKIDEISNQSSFFTKIIYPLITNGIKEKSAKQEIINSIIQSIKSIILKDKEADIVKYKKYIKESYYNEFIKWLETKEAKIICKCFLTKIIPDNIDSFEINYLLSLKK